MGRQERNLTRRAKIDFLQLSPAEWMHVGQFADLLSYADVAQQAFSSEKGSTLHLAIPALETLHKTWSSRAERAKYARFAPALTAATEKVDEYYKKTTNTPAYVLAMCACRSIIELIRANFDHKLQCSIQLRKCHISRNSGLNISTTMFFPVPRVWLVIYLYFFSI